MHSETGVFLMIRFKNKMGEFCYFEYFAFTKRTLLFLFWWWWGGLAGLKDFSKRWMGFSDSVHRYDSNLTVSPKHAPPKMTKIRRAAEAFQQRSSFSL